MGEDFLGDWDGLTVGDLFAAISDKMPKDAPGTLKKEDVASVLAYILQNNNMPSGRQELAPDRDALATITIQATKP